MLYSANFQIVSIAKVREKNGLFPPQTNGRNAMIDELQLTKDAIEFQDWVVAHLETEKYFQTQAGKDLLLEATRRTAESYREIWIKSQEDMKGIDKQYGIVRAMTDYVDTLMAPCNTGDEAVAKLSSYFSIFLIRKFCTDQAPIRRPSVN